MNHPNYTKCDALELTKCAAILRPVGRKAVERAGLCKSCTPCRAEG